jgi:hypothetical protein
VRLGTNRRKRLYLILAAGGSLCGSDVPTRPTRVNPIERRNEHFFDGFRNAHFSVKGPSHIVRIEQKPDRECPSQRIST